MLEGHHLVEDSARQEDVEQNAETFAQSRDTKAAKDDEVLKCLYL